MILQTKNIYKYTLNEDITLFYASFFDIVFENNYIKLSNGWITIKKGYSWNGCSPKIKLLGKIFGTPDGRNNQCKIPSCYHDALYQFKIGTKEDADFIFYELLKKNNWKLAKIYYFAVVLFGKF